MNTPPIKNVDVDLREDLDCSGVNSHRPFLKEAVERIREAENAYRILRDKGYGKAWMSLEEIARLVPTKTE